MSAQAEQALARAEAALAARDVHQALEHFNQAEHSGADPDRCAGGRWWCSMLAGAYEQAWCESDAIRRRGAPDPHRVWDGRPVPAGSRVLVRSVHGFGDLVQMGRFLPRLHAEHVAVQCAPPLCELARWLPGVSQAVPWGSEPAFDVQLEAMELPLCVRATVADVGCGVPYLEVPPLPLASAASPRRRRVGLVWAASSWNPARSVPLATLAPLLRAADLHHLELWSLCAAEHNSAWRQARPAGAAPVAGEASVFELARAVAAMDLVITVDTLAAHLAGALGKPCFILLEHQADWRWMVGRDDSPWYPSVRLFRQEPSGGWSGVVRRVAAALAGEAGAL